MGNHAAGKAMGLGAGAFLRIVPNPTREQALQALDDLCEGWRGCDAEFEAEDPHNRGRVNPAYTFYTDPKGPLGRLIAAAFAPGEDWIGKIEEAAARARLSWPAEEFDCDSPAWTSWYEGPEQEFKKRYEFC